MKYAWIDAYRREFGLSELCGALKVSISGYRAGKRGGVAQRQQLTDPQMLALIQAIHAEFNSRAPMAAHAWCANGKGVASVRARSEVERLMRENGIHARHKRRYKVTTDSRHTLPVAENLLDRQFTPTAPNQIWISDITYLWTDEG